MRIALASRTTRLLAGFAVAVAVRGAQIDACALLSSEAIRRATGEQVTNTKATSQTTGKVRQSQCFYTLPTFINSISVTLTSPAGSRHDAAREVWEHWFHRSVEDKDRGKDRSKPESDEGEAAASAAPVAGVGDEAFWVNSFVGNLYVRKGNRFMRISLGGKMNDEERQARAKALAADALRRLR
jgi:hypothetical protein